MPGEPIEKSKSGQTEVGQLTMTMTAVELPDGFRGFGVSFADFPPRQSHGDKALAQKTVDAAAEGTVRRFGEVEHSKLIQLGTHPGREIATVDEKHRTRSVCRVYMVGNRLYTLMCRHKLGQADEAADADRFLDSFKIRE
jgi:hypothetical protein